jgi:cell division septation protein DedD
VKTVAGISGGIPRLVNTLCDRALEAAYERQVRVVDPDAVLEAAGRLRLEVPTGLNLAGPSRAPKIAAAVAALLVVAGGLWWWTTRSTVEAPVRQPVVAPQPAALEHNQAAPVAEPQPAAPPSAAPASAPPVPETSTTAPAGAPTPASDAFQIPVAAFRTESRAQEVAAAVSALQVPSAVRPDATGGWFRVVAGPFPTREAADAAQDVLTRGGYPGTRVSQVPSDAR